MLADRPGHLDLLADDASEHLAAADLGTWRNRGGLVKPRGKLVPGLTGPVVVTVRRVPGQHGARVPLVAGQQPAGALCPGSSHEPFGEAMGARRQRHPVRMIGIDVGIDVCG